MGQIGILFFIGFPVSELGQENTEIELHRDLNLAPFTFHLNSCLLRVFQTMKSEPIDIYRKKIYFTNPSITGLEPRLAPYLVVRPYLNPTPRSGPSLDGCACTAGDAKRRICQYSFHLVGNQINQRLIWYTNPMWLASLIPFQAHPMVRTFDPLAPIPISRYLRSDMVKMRKDNS